MARPADRAERVYAGVPGKNAVALVCRHGRLTYDAVSVRPA